MLCSCRSNRQQFSSEICIHFPGVENLTKPAVFAFPLLSVCLECGATEFKIGESELLELRKGVSAHGTSQNGGPREPSRN